MVAVGTEPVTAIFQGLQFLTFFYLPLTQFERQERMFFVAVRLRFVEFVL
jgi:hypothetical protein